MRKIISVILMLSMLAGMLVTAMPASPLMAIELVPTLTLTPAVATVLAGGNIQFTASEEVVWSVEGAGGVDTGTITADGLYTAPLDVPLSGYVRVQATSVATGIVVVARVWIASATADGTFTPVASTSVQTDWTNEVIWDLDGDGLVDLWHNETNLLTGRTAYLFHKGLGDGLFAAPISSGGPMGNDSFPVLVGDLNNDGIPDLVRVAPLMNAINWALGTGDGNFPNTRSLAVSGFSIIAFTVADLDNDGYDDVVIRSPDAVRVLWNDGAGNLVWDLDTHATGVTNPDPANTNTGRLKQVIDADVDGNGYADILVLDRSADSSTPGTVTVFLNNGSKGFSKVGPQAILEGKNSNIFRAELADLNGDGKLDMVVSQGTQIRTYQGKGDGTFGPSSMPIDGFSAWLIHAGSDEHGDLLVRSTDNKSVALWRSDGSGGFTSSGTVLDLVGTDLGISRLVVTELNRDGQYDLAMTMFKSGAPITYMVGTLLGGPVTAPAAALRLETAADGVNTGNTLPATAMIIGTLDNRVEWSVNGVPGGDSAVGTITVVDSHTAVYHVGTAAESLGSVTLEARSIQNGTLTASKTIALTDYLWERPIEQPSTLDIQKLALSADGNLLYAGTPQGIFRSEDGGRTWINPANSSWPAGYGIYQTLSDIAVDPDDPLTLYASPYNPNASANIDKPAGVYKSTDGGESWSGVNANIGVFQMKNRVSQDLLVLPGGIVFAANGLGLLRSTDGGGSWERVLGPTEEPFVAAFSVSADPSNSSVLYATTGLGEAYRSIDGGATWSLMDTLTGYALFIEVDPFNGDHLLARVDGVLKESRDGGLNWEARGAFVSPPSAVFSPLTEGMVLSSTGFSISISLSQAAISWHDISNGLITESGGPLGIRDIAISPAGDFYAATSNGVYKIDAKVKITYTVTFKDHDGTELKTETVEHGSAATAPANPTRTGYTFTGWDTDFTVVTADLTVTAAYEINTYTVTFKDHDGTELKTETVEHGSAATAPANPTRTGYTFTGWDTDFTGVTADLTVTAEYEINTYTVSFNSSGGSDVDSQNLAHGSTATQPADPNREGYHFAGWYADEELTEIYDFDTPVTADIILYAKWAQNVLDDDENRGTFEDSFAPPAIENVNNTVITSAHIDKVISNTPDGMTVETFNVQEGAATQIAAAKAEGKTSVQFIVGTTQTAITEVNIPPTVLEGASGMNVSVITPNATLEIPAALVNTLSTTGKELHISVSRGGEVSSPAYTSVLGTPCEIKTDIVGTTKVTIPLGDISIPADPGARANFLASLAVFAYHSDGEKEIITGEFIYDAKGNPISISFPVDKFSTFAIVKLSKRTLVLTINSDSASINGVATTLDAKPFIEVKLNRTLVPLRFISETMGAKVEWLPSARQIIIKDSHKEITLTLDSKTVFINGKSVHIDCAPVIAPPGRTFLPLRFISETLGAKVTYYASGQISIIREYK